MLHTFIALIQDRPGVLTHIAALALLLPASCPVYAQAEAAIRVRVLDGHTGKPYAHTGIVVWDDTRLAPGHPATTLFAQPTDDQGVSIVQASPHAMISVHVSAEVGSCFPRMPDKQGPYTTSVTDILRTGVISPNICGKPHVQPRPGELIVFQRPLHWYERLAY